MRANAQHAVVGARRQSHALDGVGEQPAAALVGHRHPVGQGAVGFRIGAHRRSGCCRPGIAFALHGARRRDAAGDVDGPLGRRRQSQIGRRNRRHVDRQVDAVEPRSGDP